MTEILKYITDHWQLFTWTAAVTAGCVGALVYVAKVKVPAMENRLTDLEVDMKGVKENGVVHKPELYKENGSQIYVTANNCISLHTQCLEQQKRTQDAILKKICEVKDAVELSENKRQRNSLTFFSFMAAVKEKLELQFTIPKDGGA